MAAEIGIETRARSQLVDITDDVRAAVRESGVDSGLCVVYVPHTTAAVTINEGADPDVAGDLSRHLASLVPEGCREFRHSEGNSDAHVKAALVGPSVTLIVEGGLPLLGTWQRIFFCEFDGPRRRRYRVKVVGG